MSQDPVQRWQAFLDKIKQRFEEMMAQAVPGCTALLDATGLESVAMSNAWTGVVQQTHQLTWSDKVEETMEAAGIEDDAFDAQRAKGDELVEWIELERERTEVRIFADAARTIMAAAMEVLAKDFPCTQCKAALTIPQRFFRSAHVTCVYCNTVNTWEPGSRVRAVEHFCTHHLAREAAWDEWVTMQATDRARHGYDESAKTLKAYEAATIAFNTTYLRARIEVIPQYADQFDADLEGRMRQFYLDMKYCEAWPG